MELNSRWVNEFSGNNCLIQKAYIVPIKDSSDEDFFATAMFDSFLKTGELLSNYRLAYISAEQNQKYHQLPVFYFIEKEIWLLFEVDCPYTGEYILHIGGICHQTYFVNGHKLFRTNIHGVESEMGLVALRQGINIFMIRIKTLTSDYENCFSLRISDYKKACQESGGELLRSCLMNKLIRTEVSNIGNNVYEYYFCSLETVYTDFNQKCLVELIDAYGQSLCQYEGQFNRALFFNISPYIEKNAFVSMKITYCMIDGTIRSFDYDYIACMPNNQSVKMINSIECRWHVLKNHKEYNNDDIINIEQRIFLLKDDGKKNTPNLHIYYSELLEGIEALEKGEDFCVTLISRGSFDFFYLSELDRSLRKIVIQLPPDFRLETEYPVVIYPDAFESWFFIPRQFRGFRKKSVIIAAFISRGLLTGNVIGEFCFFEALEKLISVIPCVKPYGLSLIGFSASAYAIYAYATLYPHIFKNIACFAARIDLNKQCNISNIYSFNVFAENDEQTPKVYLEEFRKNANERNTIIHQFPFMIHASPFMLFLDPYIIDWCLDNPNDATPSHVCYITDSSIHHSTHFVKNIMHCRSEMVSGSIDIWQKSDLSFVIQTDGVESFELLPPSPGLVGHTKVFLNRFEFDIVHKDNVRHSFIIEENNIKYTNDCRWDDTNIGVGFLRLYREKLTVCLLGKFLDERNILNDVAINYASPKNNSISGSFDVMYPIIYESSFNDEIKTRSVLLLGIHDDYNIINEIVTDTNCILRKDGLLLHGNDYPGEYCLMYISEKKQHNNFVGFVFGSNEHMIRKLIFSRRMLIPSYCSGKHPFLHSPKILFQNGELQCFD